MSLIDVTAHPLLTNKVTLLAPEKFAAQQDLAEALLGLEDAFVDALTAAQLTRVQLAVALQLNFQVEMGLDPYVIESESSQQQGEARKYRPDAIHPQALAIVEGVVIVDTTITDGDIVQQFRETSTVRSVRTDEWPRRSY